jgi:hypothetical protein
LSPFAVGFVVGGGSVCAVGRAGSGLFVSCPVLCWSKALRSKGSPAGLLTSFRIEPDGLSTSSSQAPTFSSPPPSPLHLSAAAAQTDDGTQPGGVAGVPLGMVDMGGCAGVGRSRVGPAIGLNSACPLAGWLGLDEDRSHPPLPCWSAEKLEASSISSARGHAALPSTEGPLARTLALVARAPTSFGPVRLHYPCRRKSETWGRVPLQPHFRQSQSPWKSRLCSRVCMSRTRHAPSTLSRTLCTSISLAPRQCEWTEFDTPAGMCIGLHADYISPGITPARKVTAGSHSQFQLDVGIAR